MENVKAVVLGKIESSPRETLGNSLGAFHIGSLLFVKRMA